MEFYKLIYKYDTYYFKSFPKLWNALRDWWRADGREPWFDTDGKRSHFPTVNEVSAELDNPDGFYRDIGDSGNTHYVVIKKEKVRFEDALDL